MKKISTMFFGLLVALMLCSCASDQYYQNRAADRAREYLLERSPELSAEQVEYVKFNDPVLLIGEVLGEHSLGDVEKTSSIQRQICVSWQIPGKDELYMVMGVSADNMTYWHPQRLIRKKFVNTTSGQEAAVGAARKYITLNLYDELNAAELNKVLYQFPAIVLTNFELNFNPDGTKSEKEIERSRKSAAEKKQFSLLWANPDRNIVVSGYGNDEMNGWSLMFVGVLSDKDVQDHLIKEINAPEVFYRPIDLSEKEPSTKE